MKTPIGIALAVLLAAGAAFGEDAYLLSDGNQAIDIGRPLGPQSRVELDFKLTKPSEKSQRLFGTTEFGLDANFYVNSALQFAWSWKDDSGNNASTGVAADTERHTVVIDSYKNVVTLTGGGVNYSTTITTTRTKTSACAMGVFARQGYNGNPRSLVNRTSMYLYSLRVYEAGELVGDYVPARTGTQVGLYDTVGGGFYINAIVTTGGKDFAYGGDILHLPGDGYVESDGTQFVNTGYFFDGTRDRVEVDAEVTESGLKTNYLFGVNAGDFRAFYWLNKSGSMEFCVGDKAVYYSLYSTGLKADCRRHTYVIDAATRKMSVLTGLHTNVTVAATNSAFTAQASCPFGLFAALLVSDGVKPSSYLSPTPVRIYSMKAYDGVSGTLKHDFRPCIKGDVAGFRDQVTGRFVTDEAKTKAARITCGGTVTKIADDPFIEHVGSVTNFIDTGYCPKANTRVVADFAFTDSSQKGYLFGNVNDGANLACYASGGTYNYLADSEKSGTQSKGIGFNVSLARRTIDIDGTGSCRFMTAGYTNTVKSFEALSGESTHTLPIFVRRKSGTTLEYFSSARLYSFKIYEGGDLVHDFAPYVEEGLVGLRDTVGEAFKASTGLKVAFRAGGAIPGDGSQEGAYLSSSRRQGINTGYKASDKSRIEIDFALNSHTNSGQRLFGYTSGISGAEYQVCGLYSSGETAGSGNFKFMFGCNGSQSTSFATDLKRHTAILDMKNKSVLFMTGTTTNYTKSGITVSTSLETAQPLGLFGNVTSSGTGIDNLTDMRVYSFKIWHDDMLAHHYLPYQGPEGVGMLDVVTGEVKTDCLSSGVPFTVGGCGWGDDKAAFYTQPSGGTLWKGDADKTLTAFAPGAVGYQWYKDGVAIKGATNRAYAVTWHKNGMNESYVVKAKFDCFGTEVERASDAAVVDSRPSGLFLIVR